MRYLVIAGFATVLLHGATPDRTAFDKAVTPVLTQNCAMCHNAKMASGGLNLTPFLDPAAIKDDRPGWERILAKLRAGAMPPKGMPQPTPAQMDALLNYVQVEFERADRAARPDPGRVTARRLNRAEYANTVRDLLGIHFRAQEEFPPDDSGYGFDNIGDVLTVSPALMEKYFAAAERIASRAIGVDPLPSPGLFNKKSRIQRLDTSAIEFTDQTEFDADYLVRVLITGHRGPQGKPVTLVISVDGKPVKTVTVESALTEVTRQASATQRTTQEVRLYLSEGPHTFRGAFVDDEAFTRDLAKEARTNPNRNMYPETFEIAGPFPPTEQRAPRNQKILICDPASGQACVGRILSTLARRAYRRPVTKSEVADLVKVSSRARELGYNPPQAIQFAIQAMLVSPQFLYRIEHDPKAGATVRISDLELATRLSYFIWSSMPDDELLHAAESDKLRQPAVLDAQVKRMLADPKSDALADNFASQWLETRSLDAVKPDAKKFPDWGPELREAMKTETRLFFEAVLRDDRPVSDFIDGKYTFINDRLARLYGIDDVKGPEFRRVELGTDQRSGILTQASVLTVSSYSVRTSPVLRGKYLLENILGAPSPPPPPDVPPLDEAAVGNKGSQRQTLEAHRSNPVCASCHSRMDVLGFGLENYDAIGRWRTEDGKFPIDASGTFPNGKTFATPAEMKALLRAELPEFTRCLTEKMLTYALGRGVETYDRLAVRDIVRQTTDANYRVRALIAGIVHSLPFQQRRAELVKDPVKEAVNNKKETATK